MEIVRNFIKVAGLADEAELSAHVKGQILQYSETETIFIPDNQPDIKSIFQIMLKVEVRDSRKVKTPIGSTVILDGVKKLKIIYTQNDISGKAVFWDMELPFNAYVEIAELVQTENINIHVLDAYFSLIDPRKIYSHFLYLVNIPVVSPLPNAEDPVLIENIRIIEEDP